MTRAIAKRQSSRAPILALFEAARKALEKARSVDELKKVRDQAQFLKFAARMAKDSSMIAGAVEIRLRAERKLGERLVEAKKAGDIKSARPQKGSQQLRLKDAGIDPKLSMTAQRMAALKPKQFEGVIKDTREKIIAGRAVVIKPLDVVTTAEKAEKRATTERLLGEHLLALPDKKFGFIVGDPEWRFEPWSRDTGMSRAADNHYPTSCTDVIAARDVPSIAAKDCGLALWATAPMLPQALLVMAAWGFDYKTHLIWHKTRNGKGRGTGYWCTGEHELLLIGTRGKFVAPAKAMCGSVIAAPVGRHSAKPEIFLEILEREFPTLPKIELNRRGPPRKGWESWGNEAKAA